MRRKSLWIMMLLTAIYATGAQAEVATYNCCGNESTPTAHQCRYLDRYQTCTNDQHCSQSGFELCCYNACENDKEEEG